LKTAGVDLPILVGGAALTDRFTRTRIAPAYESTVIYAKDAMNGLDLMQRVMDPPRRAALEAELLAKDKALPAPVNGAASPTPVAARRAVRSTAVRTDLAIPEVPDVDRHVLELRSLDEIWAFLGPQMLYVRHLPARQLREAARREGSEGARARGADRPHQGGVPRRRDARPRGVALLRGRERRRRAAPLRGARCAGSGRAHRVPAAAARAAPGAARLRAAAEGRQARPRRVVRHHGRRGKGWPKR
jgi:hypothetical protein